MREMGNFRSLPQQMSEDKGFDVSYGESEIRNFLLSLSPMLLIVLYFRDYFRDLRIWKNWIVWII